MYKVDAFFAFFERFKDISFSLGECQEQDLNMIILKSFNAQPLSFIYIPMLFIQILICEQRKKYSASCYKNSAYVVFDDYNLKNKVVWNKAYRRSNVSP